MPLSDNGKDVLNNLIVELGKWIVIIAGVVTLYIQSHNQHAERVNIAKEANVVQGEKLDTIAKEVKATQRPLVYGGEKKE